MILDEKNASLPVGKAPWQIECLKFFQTAPFLRLMMMHMERMMMLVNGVIAIVKTLNLNTLKLISLDAELGRVSSGYVMEYV